MESRTYGYRRALLPAEAGVRRVSAEQGVRMECTEPRALKSAGLHHSSFARALQIQAQRSPAPTRAVPGFAAPASRPGRTRARADAEHEPDAARAAGEERL